MFCCALCGKEAPLTNGTLKHWSASCNSIPPHIVIASLDWFKRELGKNYHLLPIVTSSCSSIDNKKWIGHLLTCYKEKSIFNGPLFRNLQGTKVKALDFKPGFFDRLEQVQIICPDLTTTTNYVVEDYGIYRSFHQGSTSEATN